jgi:formate hydrogenlyase subunit 3/multisubunit Na+/H+ antiporter MnhD subunit
VNAYILILVWLLPLALTAFAGWRHAGWMTAIAPLPALFAALLLPVGTSLSLPWLMLGVDLGLDGTGRVFLLFSSLLWLAASLYGAVSVPNTRNAALYRLFFLLAMAGNLGLIVAQDMVSFYLGFTLMGLATYGLVVQARSQQARLAARRYLVWTIAGEMLLFAAIVLLAQKHGGTLTFSALASSPPAGLAVLLLIFGFGIKLALPGLHTWLPQAYAVTPTPAVAVLSGAMIKAGLLGWLRFLPPGDAALAGWGQALLIAGIAGMAFGAVVGLLQNSPRLLLGYSSISKMGLLTTGMGAALAWPGAAPTITAALGMYAAHHALVKGALFLGLGLAERNGLRPWVLAGLVFLALALAGAPLTSGALAKSALTSGLPDEARHLPLLLAISAFATTLLMGRFLFLSWKRRGAEAASPAVVSVAAWLGLLAVIAVFPLLIAPTGQLMANTLPLLVGGLLSAATLYAARRFHFHIAIGPRRSTARRCASLCRHSIRRLACMGKAATGTLLSASRNRVERVRQRVEALLSGMRNAGDAETHWRLTGGLWLGVGGLLLAGLVFGL